MESLLKLEHVTICYNGEPVVHDVDLELNKGEILGVVGESGSGKSTIIKAIMGLLGEEGLVTRGDIWYKGENLTDMSEKKLRKLLGTEIGMVFQKPNPFPKTIFENVAYGLRVNGIKDNGYIEETVVKSLKQVVLWDEVKDKLKDSAFALSGGQQQRLCIARALAISPSILLMDEPTSALDPISTSKIEDLIHELKKEYTIVIVTHNMQQAARVSDKTGYFYLGELVEYGETRKIFTNPEKESTQNYITGRFG